MKNQAPLSQLISLLDDGNFHDGIALGESLQITRSAIWKIIKKAQHHGIPIQAVKGKGYVLSEPFILLNSRDIEKNMSLQNIIIEIFESLPSTNDYLKNFFHHKKPRICLAELQTQGKGRLQRTWHSPFGQNIYFSYLYPFQCDISSLAGLSLMISLAIVNTLKHFVATANIQVKWPNDIIFQNKKLAGCLVEVQAESNGNCSAIIGIGINVNMIDDNNTIAQPWTSLRQISATSIDRNLLCAFLITHLSHYLLQFEQQGLSSFMTEWQSIDALYQKPITLSWAQQKISGNALGIDAYGRLLLQLADGSIQHFSSGDTTIMKNRIP